MQRISLDGTWELQYGPQLPGGPRDPQELARSGWPTIAATVPGNVELDLMAAGQLPDLARGNNIYRLRELEGHDWWYRRTFPTPPPRDPSQRFELTFDGLDCLGTIWLNGQLIGRTDNMLIPHRFDVTGHLRRDGENELVIRIVSAVLEGRRRPAEPMEYASSPNVESLNVRKAPHMYGWDIMPRIVSAGLWRSVWLECVEPTRFRSIYWATLKTDPTQRSATLLLDWDLATNQPLVDDLCLRVSITRDGRQVHQSERPIIGTRDRLVLDLRDVDLWWPRGCGIDSGYAPALHVATVELLDQQGHVLACEQSRVGLRTVELRRSDITTPEEPGEFVFVVNGQKVFVKGTNWVPLDGLHSRDPQHLQAAIDMAVDLDCNMIRCWGGNVYEDHAFFDLCDQHGIMVWQDFAMACAIYPQTDDFAARIRAEAESVVVGLRNHASLALWAGNNEIDECFFWSRLGIDPNTERLSREVLPAVCRRLDPFRPYLPSSPYRSPELVRRGNRWELGPEQHLWGARDDFKGPFYTSSLAHFVSEIGYHGCPDRASLEQMLDAGHLWPWQNNDQWLTHAARPHPTFTGYDYRIPLMARQTAILFGTVPDNLDDFVLASQIVQAEAKKFFIEWWRQGKWRRTGILWWNLRDGWPIISDAIVDYYGRRKLAYQYIKRVQADVCVLIGEPVDGQHDIVAVNDTLTPRSLAGVTIRDADTGRELFSGSAPIPSNARISLGKLPQSHVAAMWLIEWIDEPQSSQRRRNHYLAGPRPFKLDAYRRWLRRLDL